MAKKEKEIQDENLENVQEALSTSGQWIEEHQNLLYGILTAVLVVVCGALAINNYVIRPHAVAAQEENGKAAVYFHAQQWEQALNGDDADCIGFAEIADKYSHYQAGKLAALYAGICEYKLGEYDEAAKYLKKFDADDVNIAPAALQLCGDAYVELGEFGKAVKMFEAAAKRDNDVIAPMSLKKAGIVYLHEGENKKAAKLFQLIKDSYPTSAEAQDIDKFIELAK